jgi:hypothetical protein
VIGHSLPNVGALGATVKLGGRILLIDGVDMKLAIAGQVINRANRVAHAFWEYSRARKAVSESLRLVGIVLNGTPQYARSERKAHNFAVHQLKKEANVTVLNESEIAVALQ